MYNPTNPMTEALLDKRQLVPHLLLTSILYGEFTWLTRVARKDGYTGIILTVGQLAKFLRVPHSRLKKYLNYLSDKEYIFNLEFPYRNHVTFLLPPVKDIEATSPALKIPKKKAVDERNTP